MRSWIYVLDEELNRSKWVKEINLLKLLKKLNKLKLLKELNELKSMNNIEKLKYIKEIIIQSFSNSWIYLYKIYILLIYSWKRLKILLKII